MLQTRRNLLKWSAPTIAFVVLPTHAQMSNISETIEPTTPIESPDETIVEDKKDEFVRSRDCFEPFNSGGVPPLPSPGSPSCKAGGTRARKLNKIMFEGEQGIQGKTHSDACKAYRNWKFCGFSTNPDYACRELLRDTVNITNGFMADIIDCSDIILP